jgi:carbon storage regulator CsrA
MLYIDREVGDGIVIGDKILIKISKINVYAQGKSVNLGFQAPKDVKIMRSELLKKEEKK